MNNIDSKQAINRSEMSTLTAERKRLLEKNQREIDAIRANHSLAVEKLHEEGEERVLSQRGRDEKRLLDEVGHNEKVLSSVSKNADITRDTLESELQSLRENNTQQSARERAKNEARLIAENNRVSSTLGELSEHFSAESKNIIKTSNQEEAKTVAQNQAETSQILSDHSTKMQLEKAAFTTNFYNDRLKHNQLIDGQRIAMQSELATNQQAHTRRMNEREQLHQQEVEKRKELQRQELLRMQKEFEKRVAQTIEENKQQLQAITGNARASVNSAMSEVAKARETVLDRAQDPFYRPLVLDPQLQINPDSYVIRLQVPEHEKDFVNISGKDRLIRVSMSRQFKDAFTSPDGTGNRSSKMETVSKEFNVPEILNFSKITKSYVDGVLQFKIIRA